MQEKIIHVAPVLYCLDLGQIVAGVVTMTLVRVWVRKNEGFVSKSTRDMIHEDGLQRNREIQLRQRRLIGSPWMMTMKWVRQS